MNRKVPGAALLLPLLALLRLPGLAAEGPEYSFRPVTVELDHRSTPTDSTAVVRRSEDSDFYSPYRKYVLVGGDPQEYFHARALVLRNQQVAAHLLPAVLQYVYDVHTYWRDEELLLVVVRYHHYGENAFYMTLRRCGERWTQVDDPQYHPSPQGLISPSNLKKLLELAERENRLARPAGSAETPRKDSTQNAVLISALVVGCVLIVILLGLVLYFYMSRRR